MPFLLLLPFHYQLPHPSPSHGAHISVPTHRQFFLTPSCGRDAVGDGATEGGGRAPTGFLTFLPHLSRFDAPTPKSSDSEDSLPDDYPGVKNMLHRLTGEEGGGEEESVLGSLPFPLKHLLSHSSGSGSEGVGSCGSFCGLWQSVFLLASGSLWCTLACRWFSP